MPALRQQDHRLNKDELVTYKYSVILVEVQSGVRSFAISQTVLIIFVTISVVFPREILINKGLVKKYGGGGGWAGAFGNVVDKKHMTHPLPSAQK